MIQHERSAIIGYYRSGATLSEICVLTGYMAYDINEVIDNYLNEIGEKMYPNFKN